MGFWGRLWRGAKRVARSCWSGIKNLASSCYQAAKSAVTTTYRTVKRVSSAAWTGLKSCYRTAKDWAVEAKEWSTDKLKQFGNWTRRQLNKTWIGKQCVNAWDFTVGGGYKKVVEKFQKSAREFLGKSSFGRGLLSVYDGCKSVVSKVMNKINAANDWCKSRLKKMGFAGEVLSDALSFGTDYVLPYVATGGLSKVMGIINKIKAAGNPALTFLVDQMPFVQKLNNIKTKMADKMNSAFKNPRLKKFCDEIKDKYNQVDDYLCKKLDDVEHFVQNNTVSSAASAFGDKLKQINDNFTEYLIDDIQTEEDDPVSYEDYVQQKWEAEHMKICRLCLGKSNKEELIELDCCGLWLHEQCFDDLIKSRSSKPGTKILLKSLVCINCKKQMKCSAVKQKLQALNNLFDRVSNIASKKLSSGNQSIANKSIVEILGAALQTYAFYFCSLCSEPYADDEDKTTTNRLCSPCRSITQWKFKSDRNNQYVDIAFRVNDTMWRGVWTSLFGEPVTKEMCKQYEIHFKINHLETPRAIIGFTDSPKSIRRWDQQLGYRINKYSSVGIWLEAGTKKVFVTDTFYPPPGLRFEMNANKTFEVGDTVILCFDFCKDSFQIRFNGGSSQHIDLHGKTSIIAGVSGWREQDVYEVAKWKLL